MALIHLIESNIKSLHQRFSFPDHKVLWTLSNSFPLGMIGKFSFDFARKKLPCLLSSDTTLYGSKVDFQVKLNSMSFEKGNNIEISDLNHQFSYNIATTPFPKKWSYNFNLFEKLFEYTTSIQFPKIGQI